MLATCAAVLCALTSDRFRFVLYGDCRDGYDMHKKLVALAMSRHPAFVIQTGDLVHTGTSASQWKTYDEVTGPMRSQIPVYPAPGNHDFGGGEYAARLTAPIESGTKAYYSFTKARWHFISLSVDLHMPYGPGTDQYNWLVSDLQKAGSRKLDIAVFFHVPPYSIGSHGSDLDVRAKLCPLFDKYGVSLVMNGHDHLYYRTRRAGITYIVSGGGGAPIYPALPNNGQIPGDKWLAGYHIVVIDADGDALKAKAIDQDGKIFDTFTIDARRRSADLNQDPVPSTQRPILSTQH